MPSPAKKRKINGSTSMRSIESFFSAQNAQPATKSELSTAIIEDNKEFLTDEELARKLQDEWNQVDQAPASESIQVTAEESNQPSKVLDEPQSPPVKLTEIARQTQNSTSRILQKDTLSLQSSLGSEDTIVSSIPLDESPLTFDPAKYLPELQKHWKQDGGDASYALLTHAFILVNSTTKRIKIVDTLVNLLRILIEGAPDSLLPAVWLATNSFAPPYEPAELGLGGSVISKAFKNIYGLNAQGLKTLYNKHGDAGDVAFEAKKRQSFTLKKPKPLTIKGVYQSLTKIAKSKGTGSQETKQRIVERLLQDTRSAEESRYIVRTLVQHLRIGAVKTTMLIALARAFLFSKPPDAKFSTKGMEYLAKLKKEELTEVYLRAEETVKASYARHPNYDDLVPCLLEIGVTKELLVRCGLTLHIPLRPMLGSITRDLSDMLTKLQGRDFACEYKYDGQRAQVHCDSNGKVSIFSRHLELMTDKYPDLVSLVPQIRGESVSSFILEGEVVAVDQDTGDLQAFQILTNRAKKNVEIGSIKVNVCLFAFDLMYLNGEPLLDRSFRERRDMLRSLFTEIPYRFTWVKNLDATSADSETVLEFFKSAIDVKCEGIMVKVLDNEIKPGNGITDSVNGNFDEEPAANEEVQDKQLSLAATKKKERNTRRKVLLSTYEPDKRLESWLKVKKDYSTSSDTLDLIPIAAWHGNGRKAKWWSPILLAVRNPETGLLEAVTKCMSGFTDKFYQSNKEKYSENGENVISRPSYIDYAGHPDVWFEPQEVWEMAFADITLSPTYTAAIGLVSEERGLSLRFPRFLRVREDKSIDEASTSDYLASLYRKQVERAREEEVALDPSVDDNIDDQEEQAYRDLDEV
ncbi:DNA ligase I, putative [Talaromyces stipitatus ATCC 10500]|uniref:DNA ligase n=1 Tax=Talaromyces stipitatus (strain ATCC 10500 / CBS 375.48 / QM 6759 / NRRL 1006) TaxID=441959 RepID=B8M5M9_TALSN|nr:DNA ligase I, putative [Talaromyces stipitatus ATCC 10500]EED19923.1 DNA ligase I, putative [Talaromyces stipitatus ATCC 10500]